MKGLLVIPEEVSHESRKEQCESEYIEGDEETAQIIMHLAHSLLLVIILSFDVSVFITHCWRKVKVLWKKNKGKQI